VGATTVGPVLAEMRIQGLGVIEDALLEFHPGFTVVTGETGAGKTMVVTGLHLLSGGRAEVSKVRTGTLKASVEGRFELGGAETPARIITDAGAEVDEDGSVIALRSVAVDGRSRAHLGGRSVPVGVLADLSEQLLAVHGQNDQLRLLRPAEQRAVIDRYAGEDVAEPLKAYRAVRDEWIAVATELVERSTRSREMAQQADMLRHGLTEIDAVQPVPGEDTELTEKIKRLAAVDELRAAALSAQAQVSGAPDGDADVPGALGLVSEARRSLGTSEDSVLRELEPRLAEAAALLADVGAELGSYLDSLDADPEALEKSLARQTELKLLTRKYAADIDGVLAWAEESRQKLSTMDTSEEALAALAARRDELAADLSEHAEKLSGVRALAATALADEISAELSGLAMGQAEIDITVQQRPVEKNDSHALTVFGNLVHAGPDGVDDVELLLRAHNGAPPLPVHKAASGGELSRVMLAIEVVLAHADTVPTLVFDEVDAGVGGRAAIEIGRRLAKLARSHQVLAVTHLPQVAAFADQHLVVDKGTSGGITRSGVRVLAQAERGQELARMLAGMDGTATGLAHAEELLAVAEADKLAAASEKAPGAARASKKKSDGAAKKKQK
jgi:DNA repair protein RecN (Recombination protein N)